MKKRQRKDRLVSRLYYISAGLLIISIGYLIMIAYQDISPQDPADISNHVPNHTSGYSMPVSMYVKTYDSIINYRREKSIGHHSSESGSIIIQDGLAAGFSRSEIDAILNDPSYVKTIIHQIKYVKSEGTFNTTVGKINLSPSKAEGYIIIKPDNIGLTLLLAIRNYSLFFCVIFILFQLTVLFKKLKDNFTFNNSLSRAIWLIGNSLLIYEVLLLITGALIMQHIEGVDYYHDIVGMSKSENFLHLDVIYGGSFITIFTGLALVVLSKLLNYGYELQQENDLTI